jgi:4-diphosphocytidyl-2-C-methyl-D-erythritol kinase
MNIPRPAVVRLEIARKRAIYNRFRMTTSVRSHSKINLGLAIGPPRPDGFHGLTTLYQALDLHDLVTVRAARLDSGQPTSIRLTCNHPGVPTDSRNTAWRMVERALERLGIAAEVHIEIDKRLPVQGGLGAGSANAAAALIGLERELGVSLPGADRLALAAEIGSDVPLFLIGGAVLGLGRGEEVFPLPDFPSYECVVATPGVSVSTPQAFRDWDALISAPPTQASHESLYGSSSVPPGVSLSHTPVNLSAPSPNLTTHLDSDRLSELSRALASAWISPYSSGVSPQRGDLAENPLLALVRTGIENDFESVVFPQYPLLGNIKRTLAVPDPEAPEQSAVYAALSGSGSAVFGLYATTEAANAAQARLGAMGITSHRTRTLPRAEYWRDMVLRA